VGDARHQVRVAPGVFERHASECTKSRGKRGCDCSPVYVARVRVGGRLLSGTFPEISEAVAWVQQAKWALRAGGKPEVRRAVPAFRDAAVSFLHRARDSQALTRSRRPYAKTTLSSYETTLRLHVLEWVEPRSRLELGALPSDSIDARTIQNMVDGLAVTTSNETARVACAALASVLRDLYGRGLIDSLPPRVLLPPPARPRERALTIVEADRLLVAAEADDERMSRSLMAPLVALLIATGARITELLRLVWGPSGLDLDSRPARVVIARETTKSEAGARVVPIEDAYALVLLRHRDASGNPLPGLPVFVREDGVILDRSSRVRSGLNRVFRAADLEGVGPHVLRHSQGTWLASAGVHGPALAARLGHADAAFTIRRYVKPTDTDLAQAPEALARLRKLDRG
jgi:integrase